VLVGDDGVEVRFGVNRFASIARVNCRMLSLMAVPSVVMRVANQEGTWPPCKGRSANPDRFIYPYFKLQRLRRAQASVSFPFAAQGPRAGRRAYPYSRQQNWGCFGFDSEPPIRDLLRYRP